MPVQDDDIEDEGLVPEQDSADSILENLDSRGQPVNIEDNEVATVPQQQSRGPSDLLPFGVINVNSAQPNDRPTIVPDEAVQSSTNRRVIMSPTLVDDCDGELILTSQGSQHRGDQSAANNMKFSSVEGDVQTVSPDFLNRHSSLDLDQYNEPPIASSQGSVANGSYPSLNEDAVSLPSSQGSYYTGMNPDSPAGSQPQSMYSVPEQFPSQSSQSSMDEGQGHSSQEMDPSQTRTRLFNSSPRD